MNRHCWTMLFCFAIAAPCVAQPPNGGGAGPGGPPRGVGGLPPGGANAPGAFDGAGGMDGPLGPGGQFAPPINPMFAAIDADGDGVITTRELRRAVVALRQLDTDGDGNITLAEASAVGPGGGDPEMALERIMTDNDRNGDGRLTPDELPGPMVQMLQGADQNGDGAIDRDELRGAMESMRNRFGPGGPAGNPGFWGPGSQGGAGIRVQGGAGGGQGANRFMQYDTNGDGRLSADELPPQMRGMLRGADTNNDGSIDPQELRSALQRMGERGGQGRGFRGGNVPGPNDNGGGDAGRNR